MSDFKIQTVTAFIAIDKATGDEGVIARNINGAWMPFICADEKRIEDILAMCIDMCREQNQPFRIIQFTTREDVTEKYIP